jgi:hypothetical protein
MKRVLFLSIILAAIAASCNKNKFETVPQVEIKSISPDVAIKGNVITLKARVTDKEGDLQDSVIIVTKFFDLTGTLLSADTSDRFSISTLKFPDTRDIDVDVQFLYGETSNTQAYGYIPLLTEDQNFSAGLIVIDKGGHRSNFAESGQILLKKL